jgi:hypothetical protein
MALKNRILNWILAIKGEEKGESFAEELHVILSSIRV